MRHLPSLAAACMLAACASPPLSTTPQWDRHFGENARMALARQIIDPEAGRNPDPVSGMDAHAARAAYDRYQKSGAEPSPQQSIFASGAK